MSNEITYYVVGSVIPGKACKILAKNAVGGVVGQYDGYYKPERDTFVLYPAKNARFYGKLVKQEIAVALVRRGD